jgi:hypothetical protein
MNKSGDRRYTRISKTKARKLYEAGYSVVIVGDNVNTFHFFDGWYLAHRIASTDGREMTFDAQVINFEFYLERELGRRSAFYLENQ